MDEEIDIERRRKILRTELAAWIESHISDFLMQFAEGDIPTLPVIEDFRLLLCVVDGADPDASDYYTVVSGGTSLHRQLGLVEHDVAYLKDRD
jgi:hypothetical protein